MANRGAKAIFFGDFIMSALLGSYIDTCRQGFIPIFVADELDAVMLAEASVAAGARVVEITCRRSNVVEDVRRVRRAFPEVRILVGSVVDDGPLLQFLQRRQRAFPGLDQLADLGADGFVSVLPLRASTIERFSKTHVMAPGVETATEAVAALEAGAHFVKFFYAYGMGEERRIQMVNGSAAHRLLPVFVTGGVTEKKIEPYLKAGAALLGAGWDVLLGQAYLEDQGRIDMAAARDAIHRYMVATDQARQRCGRANTATEPQAFLRQLSHYHPFSMQEE
jgi:2-dehydro-3-deoxyphosphogluconate aldolase/(4S)-4-hydroxy-2-oxoglutarate aldolase